MPIDNVLFYKGIDYSTYSALQDPGVLLNAVNIDFIKDGQQGLRQAFKTINSTPVNAIHSIRRCFNKLLIGDGSVLRYNNLTGNFTSLGSYGASEWTFRQYNDFIVATNGISSVLFDTDGNLYNTSIDGPTTQVAGAAGAAGNPDGTYVLYASFLITFPNGKKYETGLSPISDDVTVTTQKIEWSDIPICTYVALSGTNPTIHRRLYRGPGTGGSLGDIYYVDTIADNTTTIYSDNNSDTILGANDPCTVEDYIPGPVFKYQEWHYGRWYGIKTTQQNRLYFSEAAQGIDSDENEALMPLAFYDNNWDDIKATGFDADILPMGLIAWGGYLYIPLKNTWLRKYGETPDTWSYKKSWSEYGIAAPWTLDKCGNPSGIIGLCNPIGGNPALAIFNGQISQIVTSPKFDYIFEKDLNIDAIETCRGKWDGRYYHFFYPNGSNTSPNKWIAFDFKRFPDIKAAYWEDLNGYSIDVDRTSKKIYIGGSDGYVRENADPESINIEVETHELVGGDVKLANHRKTLKELRYSIDTGGKDIELEIYIDDVLAKWPDNSASKTISGTSNEIQFLRSFPPNWDGYKYRLKITGEDLITFNLYSPWTVEFDLTE